jgi:putative transposase
MARKARIIVEGGYHHILTRGNNRKRIFYDNQDCRRFKETAKSYLEKFQVFILHYCLMPNHLHFLMKVQKAQDLAKFMQAVLQVYANYFRKKYDSVGFTFQNRYKSHIIESDLYLLECARYIERNPLRAGIINNLSDYSFSSFHYYAKGVSDELINLVDPMFLELGTAEETRQRRYLECIMEDRPYEQIVDKMFNMARDKD